jgi:hypothetical protein
VQSIQFQSDLGIIPLQHFDILLGYDWLEHHSPMRVHWATKWMSIPYGTTIVLIQGIIAELMEGSVVQVCQLTEDDLNLDNCDSADQSNNIPHEVLELLHQYKDIFCAAVSFTLHLGLVHILFL